MSGDPWLLWNDVDAARLPKISLHDHLDGALRPATIVEIAEQTGFPLPTPDAASLADWFHASADAGVLVDYLKTFDVTIGVMQNAAALIRVAREYVLDLADDGVIYGEVRWAPEQHLRGGLSLDEVVEAIQVGIDQGVEAARVNGHRIRIGQLVTAMRHADRGLEIAELAVRHRDNGVVGFDIAGAEAGFPASRHRVAFDYLAEHMFPSTVHAGEADGLVSIQGALVDGRALRIGHGVRLAEDLVVTGEDDDNSYVTVGPLARWVRDRQIPLELCPQSNLQTGAIDRWGTTLADHPFDLLYQLGFRVTVNTDNRLMSDTTLSKEVALLTETFDYDLDDLLTFQLNAAESTFLPLEDREELAEHLVSGFEAV